MYKAQGLSGWKKVAAYCAKFTVITCHKSKWLWLYFDFVWNPVCGTPEKVGIVPYFVGQKQKLNDKSTGSFCCWFLMGTYEIFICRNLNETYMPVLWWPSVFNVTPLTIRHIIGFRKLVMSVGKIIALPALINPRLQMVSDDVAKSASF